MKNLSFDELRLMSAERETQSIGKGMIILAWLVFLGMLTFLFDDFLDDQYNPNQELEGFQTGEPLKVELQRNRYGHYVANGFINRHRVTFLVDTGATSVSVPERVAQRLGLKPGFATQVQTANGLATVYSTDIDSIELGPIKLHDVEAHINPNMHDDEILLGMSFLKGLEFSQQGDKLTIRQPYY